MDTEVETFTIQGEAASKANSRKLVIQKGKVRFVKSAPALAFERAALLQIPASARRMWTGPVAVTMRIFYADGRRDLDESVVLDALQARFTAGGATKGDVARRGVYVNDRQIIEKHVYRGIDARAPRVEVTVRRLLRAAP